MPCVFDKRIHWTDATNFPIGKATRGKNQTGTAILLQVGSSSASLVANASVKRTHNNDHTSLFVAGVEALLRNEDNAAVSFLLHEYKGYISTEEIPLRGEKRLDVSDLAQTLQEWKEDVRYIVSAGNGLPLGFDLQRGVL